MSCQRKPKTYNSQGLVRGEVSLNSSQASLFSQPSSKCSLSLDSSVEKSIPQLFLVITNGLYPGLAMDVVRSHLVSLNQLTHYLTNIFSYGLRTKQVGIAILIAKQFLDNKHFTMALVNSIEMVMRSKIDVITKASLLTNMFKQLDCKISLTPFLLDILVSWVSPHMNKRKELSQARAAKQLIQQVGVALCNYSVSGYRLVFSQVKAGLLGVGMGTETRAVLLDMLIVMGRQVLPGEEEKFVVDITENEVEESMKMPNIITYVQEHMMEESEASEKDAEEWLPMTGILDKDDVEENKENLGPGFVCSFAADIEKIKEAIAVEIEDKAAAIKDKHGLDTPGQVQLFSPAMFEESLHQKSEEKPPVTSLPGDGDHILLGLLVSSDSGTVYPVSDQSTIGRSSLCSIMVQGREVSRLHAKVVLKNKKVIIESVSKTNQIRINGKVTLSEQEICLVDGDSVQVGKEMFVWHKEGEKKVDEVSQDTDWDEEGSLDSASEDERKEGEKFDTKYVKGMVPPSTYSVEQEKNTASDDSETSVVVEMQDNLSE